MCIFIDRVKELGPGDLVEENPMTVEDMDGMSLEQQTDPLAMLRTVNVSIFCYELLAAAVSATCLSVHFLCLEVC